MGLLDLFTASSASSQASRLQDQSKEWVRSLRAQQREIERDIRALERQESKVKSDLKIAAKANRLTVLPVLAKELVRSKQAKERMYTTKANLNSVSMQIQNQMSLMKMTTNIKASADLMSKMNQLTRVSQISQQMQAMSKEMMKAGYIEEMINETMDALDAEGEVEEQAEAEVQKVIDEICMQIGHNSLSVEQRTKGQKIAERAEEKKSATSLVK